MPQVIVTPRALRGLERCFRFLQERNPEAALSAARLFREGLLKLETVPRIGRPWRYGADLRELIIPFGKSGYVALYYYDERQDVVRVVAVRHQREVGYQ